MQRILTFEEAYHVLQSMEIETLQNNLLIEHIVSRKTASFEAYTHFDLCSFDWYDVNSSSIATYRVLIYLDSEDLFIFCENDNAKEKLQSFLGEHTKSNEQTLHHFLFAMISKDMDFIADFENQIVDTEDDALLGKKRSYMKKIMAYRKEILRLKRYYTQLQAIGDGLTDNENGLISEEVLVHFNILHNRVDRCYAAILNLQDYVTQMREAYQAQIDIEQNELMKVFTLITTLFLPLSLMVGWYGMNFINMPELKSPWGYPVFIGVSVFVIFCLLFYFKKKKWF